MRGAINNEQFISTYILYLSGYGRDLLCRRHCCFIRRKGQINLEALENIITMLDEILDTKRKRHITGGILLSVSMLFCGLAFTVITTKNEENDDE